MQTIPYVDLRNDSLQKLVDLYPEKAKELIVASRRSFGMVSDVIARALAPTGDRISHDWLIRMRNPYLPEIDYYAERLKIDGIHALNVCFEWGCTSAVYDLEEGPTLTRALDWIFPKLGENLVVAHLRGNAGDFYNITWPGVSGMFQGMAPGRFAASLNQAPMRRHALTYLGDWIKNRKMVFRATGLPPAHLLRKVFEEAHDFDEAKRMLCTTPVALPVIYILAGINGREGCVIERTENDFVLRMIEQDRVCAANQFDSASHISKYGWRSRPIDSAGRLHVAETMGVPTAEDPFAWFKPPITNAHTRLALTACARNQSLQLFGYDGAQAVTEIFKLEI